MPELTTERLILTPWTLERAVAALENRGRLADLLNATIPAEWPADYQDVLPMLIDKLKVNPDKGNWGGIVMRKDRTLIGTMGFKATPDDTGTVEIGYGLISEARGCGYTTEMARSLVEWAFSQGVQRITAECLKGNQPSIRVLEKLGMRQTHESDELYHFELLRGISLKSIYLQ